VEDTDRVKTFGERFVQIKKWLSARSGLPMVPDYWLPDNVCYAITCDFARLNAAFDRTLYVGGKRRTTKDNCIWYQDPARSGHEEHARHNMPKYNFIIRELIRHNAPGSYELAAVDFFFPLPVRNVCLV